MQKPSLFILRVSRLQSPVHLSALKMPSRACLHSAFALLMQFFLILSPAFSVSFSIRGKAAWTWLPRRHPLRASSTRCVTSAVSSSWGDPVGVHPFWGQKNRHTVVPLRGPIVFSCAQITKYNETFGHFLPPVLGDSHEFHWRVRFPRSPRSTPRNSSEERTGTNPLSILEPNVYVRLDREDV